MEGPPSFVTPTEGPNGGSTTQVPLKPLGTLSGFGCATAFHMAHLVFAAFLQFGFLLTKVGL